MPRVDSHQHFWDPFRASYPWMTDEVAAIRQVYGPGDLKPLLDAARIDACVVVQARQDSDEAGELLALTQSHRFVAGVVAWLDLTDPDLAATVDRLRAQPGGGRLVGVRHLVHDEADREWLLRPEVLAGLERLAELRLTYDIVVRPDQISAAVEAVRRLPQLRFVLDHLGNPPIASGRIDEWRRAVEPFGYLANVSCKLSGLVTQASWKSWALSDLVPAVAHVYEVFGPDRLMFGSDWPVSLLAAPYQRVVEAAESALGQVTDLEAVSDRVFGLNAVSFYGLDIGGR